MKDSKDAIERTRLPMDSTINLLMTRNLKTEDKGRAASGSGNGAASLRMNVNLNGRKGSSLTGSQLEGQGYESRQNVKSCNKKLTHFLAKPKPHARVVEIG